MTTKEVRIYTCEKHPKWLLESSAPVFAGSLSVVCPLCRDEWIVANIGLADCRVEEREVEAPKT